MKKRGLLQRAEIDFKCVELILEHYSGDEAELDVAAFHLQQTIEKIMKWELASNGYVFSLTHEVHVLFQEMIDAELNPPKWIMDHYNVINDYATKTRYSESLVATRALFDVIRENTYEYLRQQLIKYEEIQKLSSGAPIMEKLNLFGEIDSEE